MVAIKGLTRKHVGAKVLVVLLDKSCQKDAQKATLATMEVDMSKNEALFYCSPDLLLSINDLDKIVIGLQAKEYEGFIRNDGNLLVNIGVLGKLTNSSCIQSKLNIDGIMKPIISKGIKFLEPMKITSSSLEGSEWNLGKNLIDKDIISKPESHEMFKNRDGSYSLRFSNYTEQIQNSEVEEIEEQ